MKHKDETGLIPPQFTGKEIEVEAQVELRDEKEAKIFYDIVKTRLLNVNNWKELAGVLGATFQLIDAKGEEIERGVQKGDYLRIDIPGPGNQEGDGYDWVLVEELNEVGSGEAESIGFRVRPTQNPFGEKNEIAHFYGVESTSSFIVMRERARVIAWIVDRNIKPNVDVASVLDKIRDSVVGVGALSMFSKMQWQKLADGFVKIESK